MVGKGDRSRKGVHRPTKAEYDQRIEMTYQLLAKGQRPSVIARAVADRFGCTTLTVKNAYLVRARAQMLAEIARAKTELRAESLALYRAVIADSRASNRDRIKAQERIDKLLALEISQAEMYGALHPAATREDGKNDEPTVTSEQYGAAIRAQILGELAKRGIPPESSNGAGDHSGNGHAGPPPEAG